MEREEMIKNFELCRHDIQRVKCAECLLAEVESLRAERDERDAIIESQICQGCDKNRLALADTLARRVEDGHVGLAFIDEGKEIMKSEAWQDIIRACTAYRESNK